MTMSNDARTWSDQWLDDNMRWPETTLVRILKGSWTDDRFDKKKYPDERIVDVGCGDAGNFPLYKQCGFKEICGVEITDEICDIDNKKIAKMGVNGCVKKGTNGSIPFPDEYFDYMVSWNALYYMGWPEDRCSLSDYVNEFARVLKPGGKLIFSVPHITHEAFRNCEELGDGYVIIRNDKLGIRNGFVFYRFDSEEDIKKQFSEKFDDFHFGRNTLRLFGEIEDINHVIGYCIRK